MDSDSEDLEIKILKRKNEIKSFITDVKGEKEQKENRNEQKVIGTDYSYKHQWLWINISIYGTIHVLGLFGLLSIIKGQVGILTILWTFLIAYIGNEGALVGAHRYFSHKSFKATPLLRLILILMQTISGQQTVYTWVRDHRLHHRYSDTDGDPHNSKRGFFFSHIGWLLSKKNPIIGEVGKMTDMSDVEADWMVMFQKKYYLPIHFFVSFLFPVMVPIHYFGESWRTSLLVAYFLRYVIGMHTTFSINSAAHLYGTRPYDKNLKPVESWFVSLVTLGEGWHNYHHAFPWDYKAAELPMPLNFSATLIRFFEKIGLAYDLKTASSEVVKNRIVRTGDGSHYLLGDDESRKAVTAVGPLHPLNPTYTTTLKGPDALHRPEGVSKWRRHGK